MKKVKEKTCRNIQELINGYNERCRIMDITRNNLPNIDSTMMTQSAVLFQSIFLYYL